MKIRGKEERDRIIESLEDSADDEYQEEDKENMIGAISYASIFASSSNRGGPRKKPVNRVQKKEVIDIAVNLSNKSI